jgi:hypothetical protein
MRGRTEESESATHARGTRLDGKSASRRATDRPPPMRRWRRRQLLNSLCGQFVKSASYATASRSRVSREVYRTFNKPHHVHRRRQTIRLSVRPFRPRRVSAASRKSVCGSYVFHRCIHHVHTSSSFPLTQLISRSQTFAFASHPHTHFARSIFTIHSCGDSGGNCRLAHYRHQLHGPDLWSASDT